MDTGPHKVCMDKWIDCAPFESLLNIKINKAENGKSELEMPFLFQYAQGAGLLHGGALIALADTAVVMAIKSILSEGTHFATTKINAEFLYPVKKGIVKAFAEIERTDNERIILGKANLFNEDGIEVLKFNAEFKIARKKRNT
jgi:acyl-CoA thioesterase